MEKSPSINKQAAKGGGNFFTRQFSGSQNNNPGEKIWFDPYTNERVWVFNPMHIVHLTKQSKSRFVRIVEGFKNFSNKWWVFKALILKPILNLKKIIRFSHVLLLLFLILYGFLGAYIFMTLEAPYEEAAKVCLKS